MLRSYGFDPSKVEIRDEDWKFGSNLPLNVLDEDGDWEDSLPIYEPQAEKYETAGCTVWGGLNQMETYTKKVYGFEPNYAERFNYILGGVTIAGANPQNTYESFRLDGVIDQHFLPIPETYEEFKEPTSITKEMVDEGKRYFEKFEYYHEWVRPSDPTKMKELIAQTLKYSPVACSVTAWIEQDGLYVDNGIPNNHWCLCYKAEKKDDGIYLHIFDSYDHSKKILHPSHTVSFAKRIMIKQIMEEVKKNIVMVFWELLKRNLAHYFPGFLEIYNEPIMKPDLIKLHEAALKWVGSDASAKDIAPDDVGCAESVSNIIHEVDPAFPSEILSTSQLAGTLDADKRYERTIFREPGVIICSPRTSGTYGHAGIWTTEDRIISNDSATGLMKINYTWDEWVKEFKQKRGLRILMWRPKVVEQA